MRAITNIDRSFRWLGRFPLAVDLADTVRVVGDQEVDLLDAETLEVWIAAELSRHPRVSAATGRLEGVRDLRDLVRGLLAAHARGESLPESGVQAINRASARSPSFPVLSTDGSHENVEVNNSAFDLFTAEVARSLIAVISEDPPRVAHCNAPRCGMFFLRVNPRQRWCSPECGNRARVARHAERVASG
ncbi:MAG: CGNR zinc finger domain-containing protein [Acidimicrobiia bacterium]